MLRGIGKLSHPLHDDGFRLTILTSPHLTAKHNTMHKAALFLVSAVTTASAENWKQVYDWEHMAPHPGEDGKPDCHHIGMPAQWFEKMKEYIKIGTKEHLQNELSAMNDLYIKSDGPATWPTQFKQNWGDYSKGCVWGEAGYNGQWNGLICHSGIYNPPPPQSAGLGIQALKIAHGMVKELPDTMRYLICTAWFEIPKSKITGTMPDMSHQICAQLFDLSDNQIAGTLPDGFLPAPCLGTFSMANNQLEGTIPKTLLSKTVLMSLKLNNNKLSGTIPEFGAMPELKELDLSNNRLSGTIPQSILKMPKLRWLRLHQNQLSGAIPADIGTSLLKLSVFSVTGNDGMDADVPESIGKLPLRVFNGTSKMKCKTETFLRHVPESTSCGGRKIGSSKGTMLPDP